MHKLHIYQIKIQPFLNTNLIKKPIFQLLKSFLQILISIIKYQYIF